MTPTLARESVVRALMTGAEEGMELVLADAYADATSAEVLSAYFTLTALAIEVAKAMGYAPAMLRGHVNELLLRCDDPQQKVM